jgi:ATP-binding cassette, subfamily B, bacterial PglK
MRCCDDVLAHARYGHFRGNSIGGVSLFILNAMVECLKQSWLLAPPRVRRFWWLLVALSLVNALLEIIAAMAMVVLMAYLAGNALPKLPGGDVIRSVTSGLQSMDGLRWLCLALAAIFTVKYLVGTTMVVLQIRLPLAAGNDLVGRLFRLYLLAPYEFHMRRNSAETIRNLTSSVDVLYRVVATSALSLLSESVSVSAIMALLLVSAPNETIIVGLIALASLFVFYRIFHHRLLVWGQRVQDMSRDGLMHARQSLDGIKDIRIAGREQFFWQRYVDIRTALTQTLVRQAQLQQIPKYLLEAFFIGLVLITVLVFSYRPDQADMLPLLGLFAYSGLRILPSVTRILIAVQLIRAGQPATASVYIDFSRLSAGTAAVPTRLVVRQSSPDTEIEIDKVTFCYEGATEPALKDISINIPHGQVVAFVGLSGAGKSTLVNVLLGLLTPQSGAIRFQGQDIRDDLRRWQSRIGYVPQAIFLLDDTLCRNVAFGVPDSEINGKRVRQAIDQAQLGELLRGLPNGVQTRVGEHGARLSGGERQRVAIARALYRDPNVFVFDEATSAIDGVTERYIVEAIERMRGQRTVIIVTHHLNLARSCDVVVFLSEGRIVASGTFADLFEENASFRAQVAAGER